MMNMSERLPRQLGALGFTEYEAHVYLALLQHHTASGYQLSKASGVPRSMVYEALGRLAQRGAILTLPEDTKGVRYRRCRRTNWWRRCDSSSRPAWMVWPRT